MLKLNFFSKRNSYLIYYLIFFLLKKKVVGSKKSKINFFYNVESRSKEKYNFFFRKIFLYQKYFYFFFLKRHIFYVHSFLHKILNDVSNSYADANDLLFYEIPSVLKESSRFVDIRNYNHGFFKVCGVELNVVSNIVLNNWLNFFYFTIFNKICWYRFNFLKQTHMFFIPTRNKVFTILRSPHKDKSSREQFQFDVRKIGYNYENIFFLFQNDSLFNDFVSYIIDDFKIEDKVRVLR